MATVEAFDDASYDPQVRGFLHRPAKPSGAGLILTHGAGGNSRGTLLIALSEAFAETGITVLRCDLPFRQQRSFGPPRPGDAAKDRLGLKNACAAVRKLVGGRISVGGQSYGGRQATMLCAEEPGVADSLLLLSYPLHAPGKPDQLRTQHLPNLHIPALFVHGTKDPFGSIPEMQEAIKLIPAKTLLLPAEGVGHDLGFKGKAAKSGDLPSTILKEFQKLLAEE